MMSSNLPNGNAIPFYKPRLIEKKDFFDKINEIFDARWFTNAGQKVQELEQRIAEIHGVKHCIAVCNGTIGLQLVIRGLELTGEVITTPFTFIATAHAVTWQGLTPVFCDIDPKTLTISPECIEEMITPKTSAILGVHVFGQPCDVDAIERIAGKHNIKVIYDAAHSFMTSYKGVPIGNFGDAAVLSFHSTKIFHTFEGGAILTNNTELAKRIRLLKNFGFNGMDSVGYLGINAKMTEIGAAYGLSFLPYVSETISKLKSIHSRYRKMLCEMRGISVFNVGNDVEGNSQYFPILVDKKTFGINRDSLWAFLWDKGIQTRRYFYPGANVCEPYYSSMPWLRESFPITKNVSDSVLCLPCYYDLKDEEIERVCELLHYAATNGDEISAWFEKLTTTDRAGHMDAIVDALKRRKGK